MAGKTLRGAGDGDDGIPPQEDEDDDARGVNSGPTVVDDNKVEAAIRKLRTLDRRPGPLTGITEMVVDSSSSEPTRIGDWPQSHARPTAVGRSLATPGADQPVTIPAAERGTMFGRSIHLPDVNAPDGSIEEVSSGSVYLTDGESGPLPLQPFPLAEPPSRAARRAAAPAPTSTSTSTPAPMAEPMGFEPPSWVAALPDADNDISLDTQFELPRRRWPRVVAVVAGIGAIGGAALLLVSRGRDLTSTPRPPAAAAPAPADDPPLPPPAPPPQEPATATAQPPAAAEPAPAPAAQAPAAAEPTEPEPTPPVRANAEVADDSDDADDTPAIKTRRKPAAKRSDPKVSSRGETAPAARPSRVHRRQFVRDDPDATMAPSLD